MRRVFVAAGMGIPKNKNIRKQARELGKMLASHKDVVYVQGGSLKGIMGYTLKAYVKQSKKLELVIPHTYYNNDAPELKEFLGKGIFNAKKTKGETGRLEILKKCDPIIALPGGTGTLEELLYCNETKRSGECKSTVYVVNIDGFYNGLIEQIKTNIEQGLSKPTSIKLIFVNNVDEIKL